MENLLVMCVVIFLMLSIFWLKEIQKEMRYYANKKKSIVTNDFESLVNENYRLRNEITKLRDNFPIGISNNLPEMLNKIRDNKNND